MTENKKGLISKFKSTIPTKKHLVIAAAIVGTGLGIGIGTYVGLSIDNTRDTNTSTPTYVSSTPHNIPPGKFIIANSDEITIAFEGRIQAAYDFYRTTYETGFESGLFVDDVTKDEVKATYQKAFNARAQNIYEFYLNHTTPGFDETKNKGVTFTYKPNDEDVQITYLDNSF